MYCSQPKYEYFCTTENKNFECVFLKKYFISWYYFIFYFLHCSIDRKYEYFCTTDNKNFKCVFLESILFKLTDGISDVLVDRLSWNLEIWKSSPDVALSREPRISKSDCFLFFFFFFFTTQKTKCRRKIDI